jgi:hypothetical protein
MPRVQCGLFFVTAILAVTCGQCCAETWTTHVDAARGSMQINLHGKSFATYSFRDPVISRPYFANINSPSGAKITRNHPPAPDDPQDHDKLHPGLWMAFGDLSGADDWRLKAPVDHVRFVEEPKETDGMLRFAVENRYLTDGGGKEICREISKYALEPVKDGVLMLWDSTFRSDGGSFYFGDQEEMGVGVRMAKAASVKSQLGGRILNSDGERDEKGVWGKQTDWCDYSGEVGSKFVGVMMMPHPANLRKSWTHARDAGLMTLNLFGQKAFTRSGEASRIEVPAGMEFRIRYGVLFHWSDRSDEFEPGAAYQHYLKKTANSP